MPKMETINLLLTLFIMFIIIINYDSLLFLFLDYYRIKKPHNFSLWRNFEYTFIGREFFVVSFNSQSRV